MRSQGLCFGPRFVDGDAVPLEQRLENLERSLRRLRRDLESNEGLLGRRSPLVELIHQPPAPPAVPQR